MSACAWWFFWTAWPALVLVAAAFVVGCLVAIWRDLHRSASGLSR